MSNRKRIEEIEEAMVRINVNDRGPLIGELNALLKEEEEKAKAATTTSKKKSKKTKK